MITLAKWKVKAPVDYPSTLALWARISNIPAEYVAEMVFQMIGEQLGTVLRVAADEAKVLVEVNVMKALIMQLVVELEEGEETMVRIKYERLQGFCSNCFYLNHDSSRCKRWPRNEATEGARTRADRNQSDRNQSYKGALINSGQVLEADRGVHEESHTQQIAQANQLSRRYSERTYVPKRHTYPGEKDNQREQEAAGMVSNSKGVREEDIPNSSRNIQNVPKLIGASITPSKRGQLETLTADHSTSKKVKRSLSFSDEPEVTSKIVVTSPTEDMVEVEKQGNASYSSEGRDYDPMTCDLLVDSHSTGSEKEAQSLTMEDLEKLQLYGTITEEEKQARLSNTDVKYVARKPPLQMAKNSVTEGNRVYKSFIRINDGFKGVSSKKQNLLHFIVSPKKQTERGRKEGHVSKQGKKEKNSVKGGEAGGSKKRAATSN